MEEAPTQVQRKRSYLVLAFGRGLTFEEK